MSKMYLLKSYVVILKLTVVILFCSCTTTENGDSIPEHTIIEEREQELKNVPSAKKVIIIAALKDADTTLEEKAIRRLLNYLYDEKSRAIEDSLTIGIRVYLSRDHYNSSSGWIAMLSKSYKEADPSITVEQTVLNNLSKDKANKFGLSEDKRKEIWTAIIKAQDKARIEAETKYPTDNSHSMFWDGNTWLEGKYNKVNEQNTAYKNKLITKYEGEVADKFEISTEIIDSMRSEGSRKYWPFPEQ